MSKLNFIDCIRSKYKYTDIFYDEMATVVNWNELCGFINKNGEEVIKCQYNSVLDFHSGLAAVKNSEGLWLNARLQRGAEGCGGWGLVGRRWSERRDGRGGASGTLQPGLQGEPNPLLRAGSLVPESGGQPVPFMEP